jgi:hypothetical protein
MRIELFTFIIIAAIVGGCGRTQNNQPEKIVLSTHFLANDTVRSQPIAENYTVEDTVRYQIGGELHYLDFNPSDSITVIESIHKYYRDEDLYREYHFIVHNHYSNAHSDFTDTALNSIYNRYMTEEWHRFYENYLKPKLDSIQSEYIDPAIKAFNGYWVYLKEYNGNYYLNDEWAPFNSFLIADSIFINNSHDGPIHTKIVEAIPFGTNGISISFGAEPIKIELFDKSRSIYRGIDGQRIYFITPTRAIHNFEVIQYTNNTGDAIF